MWNIFGFPQKPWQRTGAGGEGGNLKGMRRPSNSTGPKFRWTRYHECPAYIGPRGFLRLKRVHQELPSYKERQALLARDPLACAEGFQTLVLLTLRHLFGVRYCRRCPHCAQSENPCTDAFGSNATAMGGVFGRIDAIYGSIECQKCGTLHLHLQAFLQCYHQVTPLSQLIHVGEKWLLEMLRRYSDYSGHVRRMIYSNPEAWEEERDAVEAAWPEYKDCALMSSRPSYQCDSILEPAAWKAIYLATDVEELQKRKQHHVHLPGPDGERRPLNHCQDPKDATKCKSGFPRTRWETPEPFLACRTKAKGA